jgi:hypothetical protein
MMPVSLLGVKKIMRIEPKCNRPMKTVFKKLILFEGSEPLGNPGTS